MQDVIPRFQYGATVEETTRNFATIAVVFWYCIGDLPSGACGSVDSEALDNNVVRLHMSVAAKVAQFPLHRRRLAKYLLYRHL